MKRFFIIFFAAGFYIGYIPVASGTFATAAAAVLWWLLPDKIFPLIFIIFTLIAFSVCGPAENIFGKKDDGRIVIDEIVGFFCSVIFLPKKIFVLIMAFAFFRLLDIKKPFFIKTVQNFRGGVGIMADDIISGIFTNIITLSIYNIAATL
ncbi:MAG: Phosphatidylglycerophosphatase A [Elusimicrobia bacterium ADurb.Bin231]|nr:MAG: Phosphatidylglycerophosphatase A [Elusimicrobia bacterium ADurb.Bin231]